MCGGGVGGNEGCGVIGGGGGGRAGDGRTGGKGIAGGALPHARGELDLHRFPLSR